VHDPSCELRLGLYPIRPITPATTASMYWVPVGIVAGLIFFLSSVPTPERYLWFFQWAFGDKMGHALEYGALSILCYRAFRHGTGSWAARHAFLLAVVASAAYGMTDEWHQYFVPSRSADGMDVLADTAGAVSVLVGWRQLWE
jgi:VanZ like family